jgi:photosystem I subunit 2
MHGRRYHKAISGERVQGGEEAAMAQTAVASGARASGRALARREQKGRNGCAGKRGAVTPMAQEQAAPEEKSEKKEKKEWTPPPLDPNTPTPIFGGSTGGLLRKAQTEEFYVITWASKKEQLFEMPTGGSAIMREGNNLLKLARKEQCLALLAQVRSLNTQRSSFLLCFHSQCFDPIPLLFGAASQQVQN